MRWKKTSARLLFTLQNRSFVRHAAAAVVVVADVIVVAVVVSTGAGAGVVGIVILKHEPLKKIFLFFSFFSDLNYRHVMVARSGSLALVRANAVVVVAALAIASASSSAAAAAYFTLTRNLSHRKEGSKPLENNRFWSHF